MTARKIGAVLILLGVAGCGETEPSFAPPTPTPTLRATPPPTPTLGANVVFMGVLRPDDTLLDLQGYDAFDRPVFLRSRSRNQDMGFQIVIEARPGTNGVDVGLSAFNSNLADPAVRPDLQMEATRSLGNGSAAVCDGAVPLLGGVPGIDPPSFDATQRIADAINDFGCRFNDGTGKPQGREASDGCALFPDGDLLGRFVNPDATIEFCAFINRALRFPAGDTVLTARVRDEMGVLGPARQMIVRVMP